MRPKAPTQPRPTPGPTLLQHERRGAEAAVGHDARRWAAWRAAAGFARRYRPREFHQLLALETKWERLIRVDAPRTFPDQPAFDAVYRRSLRRVLQAYANLNPDVGYCQGMNFIAGLLLLVSGRAEEETFWVFVCLMEDYDLKGFFRDGFPLLDRYVLAFCDLLEDAAPEVAEHLACENVPPQAYLHQWYLTLFINTLPMATVLVIWDGILADGLHVLLPVAVSLLDSLRYAFLAKRFEDIFGLLKSMKCGLEGESEAAEAGRLLMLRSGHLGVPPRLARQLREQGPVPSHALA